MPKSYKANKNLILSLDFSVEKLPNENNKSAWLTRSPCSAHLFSFFVMLSHGFEMESASTRQTPEPWKSFEGFLLQACTYGAWRSPGWRRRQLRRQWLHPAAMQAENIIMILNMPGWKHGLMSIPTLHRTISSGKYHEKKLRMNFGVLPIGPPLKMNNWRIGTFLKFNFPLFVYSRAWIAQWKFR